MLHACVQCINLKLNYLSVPAYHMIHNSMPCINIVTTIVVNTFNNIPFNSASRIHMLQ